MSLYRVELKELLVLAIPATLSQLSQMALGVIDTMMAGRVNPEALAAIAVGTNILNPIIVFILGVFLALNPIVAHLNGRGDFNRIGTVFQHAVFLALVLAVPTILIIRNTEWIMSLIGIQPSLIPIVDGYLDACSYGLVGLFIFLALRFCNEGLFANKAIMIVTISSIPFNIVCNYWFIWGGFGIEPMGVIGVGYATSVVWFVMFLGLASYTVFTKRYQHLSITDQLHKYNWPQLKEFFTLGLPMGVGVAMEVAMFAIIGLLIGRYTIDVV
ncbi:MAG: MATE family efflux transporter, partial [Kangiellaceae bacterium]|nr:MATE family efflux transporter [Kangiellaceae bacterium]